MYEGRCLLLDGWAYVRRGRVCVGESRGLVGRIGGRRQTQCYMSGLSMVLTLGQLAGYMMVSSLLTSGEGCVLLLQVHAGQGGAQPA